MAVETTAQINARLEQIRDETAIDGNTKERIYHALKNIYDTLSDQIVPYSPILAHEFGDEPTVDLSTQKEFNEYMITKINGTTTPPAETFYYTDKDNNILTDNNGDAFIQ